MARACSSVTSPVKALAVRAWAKMASTAAASITASSWAMVIRVPFAGLAPSGAYLLSLGSTGFPATSFPARGVTSPTAGGLRRRTFGPGWTHARMGYGPHERDVGDVVR